MQRHNESTSKRDTAKTSGQGKVNRKRKFICREYPSEDTEHQCGDCQKTVCNKRCFSRHRNCCSGVVTQEFHSREMKTHLSKNKADLLKKIEDIKKSSEQQTSNFNAFLKMYSDIEEEIRTACQNVVTAVKEKEKELLDKLCCLKQEQSDLYDAALKASKMAIEMYQQQSHLTDEAVKSDCEKDIFEMVKLCETEEDGIAKRDTNKRRTVTEISFRNESDKLVESFSKLPLGEVVVTYEKSLSRKISPVLQDTTDTRVTGDQYRPYPTDVTVLDVNGIDTVVVTDHYNKSVKSFFSWNDQTCHSRLTLDGGPWSLTHLKHNQVVVTVPNTNQIATVEVNPNLQLLSTIKTTRDYYGITALPSWKLAASSKSPPSVDILDIEGTILKSISSLDGGQVILQKPEFICTTNNHSIIVTDRGLNAVLCLTHEGDLVFIYQPAGKESLRFPQGITTNDTGDIVFVDYSMDCVIQLTESGQFVRSMLKTDDIDRPSGICLDGEGNVYITVHKSGSVKKFTFGN